jgi:hypothetical protein
MSRSIHVPLGLVLAACGASEPNDASEARTSLLITGDRVTLPADGGPPRVVAAPGREKIGFFAVRVGDHAAVIPNDLRERVARGELAASLFEIGAPAEVDEPQGKLVDLHFDALDSAGNSTFGSGVLFGGPRGFQFIHPGETASLVQGQRYEVEFVSFAEPIMLVQPILIVEENTDLVLDGRLARLPEVSLPGQAIDIAQSQIGYINTNGAGVNGQGGTTILTGSGEVLIATAQLGPPPAPGDVTSYSIVEALGQRDHEPYVFAHREDGFMTGYTLVGTPDRLATVNARIRATADQIHEKRVVATLPDLGFTSFDPVAVVRAQGPFEQTSHYLGDPGMAWQPTVEQLDADGQFVAELGGVVVSYPPGRTVDELWNRAPFGPAFSVVDNEPQAARDGDVLTLRPTLYSDVAAPSRLGISLGDQHLALFRNDALVAEAGGDPFSQLPSVVVPPGPADYRLEAGAKRDPSASELSTEVSATWTFRSAHTAGAQALALPTMRFAPGLDRDNAAIAGLPLVLPVHVERLPGAPTPAIRAITVEASFDDGATWRAVPGARLGADFLGVVLPPARATFLSLRGTARDAAGNRVDQTILRAAKLRRL